MSPHSVLTPVTPLTQMDTDVTTLPEVVYPPCTNEEDTFALAVVEAGGNVAGAHKLAFPDYTGADRLVKGNLLLQRPQVALRIRDLTDAIQESSLISVGAHLQQLASIRDHALFLGQTKTALNAEIQRAEVVGINARFAPKGGKNGGNQTIVQFNVVQASPHDGKV